MLPIHNASVAVPPSPPSRRLDILHHSQCCPGPVLLVVPLDWAPHWSALLGNTARVPLSTPMTDEYLVRVPRQLVRALRGQGQALPWGQGRSRWGQRSPAFVKEEGSLTSTSLAWERSDGTCRVQPNFVQRSTINTASGRTARHPSSAVQAIQVSPLREAQQGHPC